MPSDPDNPGTVDYDPKPFLCKNCGLVLGESYREPGKRITQLRVRRHPISLEWYRTNPVMMTTTAHLRRFIVIQANDCGVVCSICGEVTSWYANQTAIEDMLSRQRKRRKDAYESIA
jgi:hypothetical protein